MKKYLQFITILSLLPSFAQAAAKKIEEYQVTAKKLDLARSKLLPKTGSSSYSFSSENIENLPQGQATQLNQALLRAPGITQDSYGQIHVRGDHSNLQYRINDVILPEGIGGYGQLIDLHYVDSFELHTGALPAQYGYRTAGVIDIKTKTPATKFGGRSEVMVGSFNTTQVSQQVSGTQDRLSYFISGTYAQNDRGFESPTKARNSIHNDTQQNRFFSHFSYLLDAKTKLNLILGNAQNKFQIPNNPNQDAAFELDGVANFDSAKLNQTQTENNQFAIAALQGVTDYDLDYQFAAFVRTSSLKFRGDDEGDLIFNGVASDITKKSVATGLQSDFGYKLNNKNTLRFGFNFINDAAKNWQSNKVFAADADGEQTSTTPFLIKENGKKNSQLYGAYLQNEWKATQKLTLNYGARFDHSQSYIDESALSPRLGGVYNLSNVTKLHFGYARYFTVAPNELLANSTVESYQNTTNATAGGQNSRVRAERTNYYDIGVKHKLNDNANIGLDAYYKDIRNLLDKGQFGSSMMFTPFNYARGKAYGVEFTSDYKKDNFSSFFNLAYQSVKARRISSGEHMFDADEIDYISNNYVNLDHQQQISASAGLAYIYRQTKLSTDGFFGNGLRKGFANSSRMPSYFQLNAAIARDFTLPVIDKFNLRLSAINLFDRTYMLRDGSGIGVGAPQYAQRRGYYLTFSKSF